MRIVNWNSCKGTHAIKLAPLFDLKPSIAILQESPRPVGQLAESQLWHGDNDQQGLLVLGFDGCRVESAEAPRVDPPFFLPVHVHGAMGQFNLLAAWVKPGTEAPRYISTIRRAMDLYEKFIKSGPTLLVGDLNTDWCVEEICDRFELVSAYHAFHDVAYGRERHATLYFCWNRSRRYHFDYCFIPKTWQARLQHVEVGSFNQWTAKKLSDHCPVIVDLK
jgi:hypothetical protein